MQQNTFGTSFFDSVRRSGIYRADARWFGGVASGYAARMNVSPLLVRTAFLVLSLFGGLGAIIYGVSWALLPEQRDGRIHLQEAIAGRFDGALALAGAVTLTGLLSSGASMSVFGFAFRTAFRGLFALGVIALVIGAIALLIAVARPGRTSGDAAGGPGAAGGPSAGAGGFTAPAPVYQGASGTAEQGHGSAESSAVDYDDDAQAQTDVPASTGGEREPEPVAQAAPTQAAPGQAAPARHTPPVTVTMPVGDAATPPIYAAAVPQQPTAPPPVYQKAPARRRTPGPGRRVYLLSLALPLLAAAGILAAWHWGALHPPYPLVAIFGAATVLLGVIIISLGIAGRRAGAINVLAIIALIGGSILGGMTLDPSGSRILAWEESRTSVEYYNIDVTSVEQLQSIDWALISNARWTTLNILIDPETLDADSSVEIPLDFATSMSIVTSSNLPVDLRVTGFEAYLQGDFTGGELTTIRARGDRDSGYSIARDGYVRYQNFPVAHPLDINIFAPSGAIYYGTWRD